MSPERAETLRSPITIAVQSFLKDHLFEGKAVLPAVTTMQLLADAINVVEPKINIFNITDAQFDKFLYLPSDKKKIPALCDQTRHANGDITVALLTQTTSSKASITRVKTHATISFPRHMDKIKPLPLAPTTMLHRIDTRISSKRIYRELVPFGPAYQNIQGDLLLSRDGAIATVQTPAGHKGTLGSPFTLDAALHAACVWGQRYAGFVAFPVGFKKRCIFNPTLSGATYICRIIPASAKGMIISFDIWISDSDGIPFETIIGVQMRDVGAGRMKPRRWILTDEE